MYSTAIRLLYIRIILFPWFRHPKPFLRTIMIAPHTQWNLVLINVQRLKFWINANNGAAIMNWFYINTFDGLLYVIKFNGIVDCAAISIRLLYAIILIYNWIFEVWNFECTAQQYGCCTSELFSSLDFATQNHSYGQSWLRPTPNGILIDSKQSE